MMKNIYLLFAVALIAVSCKGTWLMYDTDQTPMIYIEESLQTKSSSFALIPEDEITITQEVHITGEPSDRDREFAIEYFNAEEGETFSTGNTSLPVSTARLGTDFDVENLLIPAGEVKASFTITIHRQPEMLDKYLLIGIKLSENEEFKPCTPDSLSSGKILTPYYKFYITDGEPTCPSGWHSNAKAPLGWDFSWGNFYPQKFRKLLEYFHATEETNPTFYAFAVEKFGYNLENPTGEEKFWRNAYAAAWAKYVAMPLYDYYVKWYAEHPDDPYFEEMGDDKVNINSRIGWGNPMSGRYGFLN